MVGKERYISVALEHIGCRNNSGCNMKKAVGKHRFIVSAKVARWRMVGHGWRGMGKVRASTATVNGTCGCRNATWPTTMRQRDMNI